jgi:hypothetical protein
MGFGQKEAKILRWWALVVCSIKEKDFYMLAGGSASCLFDVI